LLFAARKRSAALSAPSRQEREQLEHHVQPLTELFVGNMQRPAG
jgi:hypothetical protein